MYQQLLFSIRSYVEMEKRFEVWAYSREAEGQTTTAHDS
jgi:hypothetical protein